MPIPQCRIGSKGPACWPSDTRDGEFAHRSPFQVTICHQPPGGTPPSSMGNYVTEPPLGDRRVSITTAMIAGHGRATCSGAGRWRLSALHH
jgi:hypothetical protein